MATFVDDATLNANPIPPRRAGKIPQFVVGQEYNRRDDIHLNYGGSRQNGISSSAACPAIFLFTGVPMKLRQLLTLSIFALLLCSTGYAQPAKASVASNASIATISSTTGRVRDDPEVISIQAQNKIIKEYHSSLLDTVYWALAGVATMALLLAGFGWFTNFKFYEADKQRLKEEFLSRNNEFEAKLMGHVTTAQSATLREIELKLEAFMDRLGTNSVELRAEIAKITSTIEARITELDKSQKRHEEDNLEIVKNIASCEADLREVEENIWDIKKVPSNILITQSQGLRAAVKADNRFQVKNILNRMTETIETAFLSKNTPISPDALNIVTKTLNERMEYDAIPISGVLAKVNEILVKD